MVSYDGIRQRVCCYLLDLKLINVQDIPVDCLCSKHTGSGLRVLSELKVVGAQIPSAFSSVSSDHAALTAALRSMPVCEFTQHVTSLETTLEDDVGCGIIVLDDILCLPLLRMSLLIIRRKSVTPKDGEVVENGCGDDGVLCVLVVAAQIS